jgi:hypothetical protein
MGMHPQCLQQTHHKGVAEDVISVIEGVAERCGCVCAPHNASSQQHLHIGSLLADVSQVLLDRRSQGLVPCLQVLAALTRVKVNNPHVHPDILCVYDSILAARSQIKAERCPRAGHC